MQVLIKISYNKKELMVDTFLCYEPVHKFELHFFSYFNFLLHYLNIKVRIMIDVS